MLKRLLLLQTLFFCLLNLDAQVKSNMRLGIETGFLLLSDSENLGLFLNVEPKLKIGKNTFMGLRIGIVLNPQKFENHDPLQFKIGEEFDNGGISLVPTLDHYFKEINFKGKSFRPYLGLGVGPYLLTNYVDVISNTPRDEFEVPVNKQVGVLFRGGFESNKLRIGLEYNFTSKANIEIPNGQIIGTVENSYLGLSIGFILGGE